MKPSPLLPLHQAAGARLRSDREGFDVITYGDVPGEYQAAQQTCVVFDETSRGLVQVKGPERASFLQRITANSVHPLLPGQGNRNLLLNSKGKVLYEFDLLVEPEAIDLSVAFGRGASLLAELDKYVFSEPVQLVDSSHAHAPLELCGPLARRIVSRVAAAEPPVADHEHLQTRFSGIPLRVTSLPVAGSPGYRLEFAPEHVPDLWRALLSAGALPAGMAVRDILRIEAGQAQWGSDIDENVYPQEARLEQAFSLEKGCYIGQEVVAKIDTYGGLNKRLMALRISHDEPLPRGAKLYRESEGEWRELGLVTSWAYSFALDGGLALGYVKRRHQAPGTLFRIEQGPATATIVALPVRAGAVPVSGAVERAGG